MIGNLLIDPYHPEIGRYGEGPALEAAEHVFAADSALAGALLRHRRIIGLDPQALAAVSMVVSRRGVPRRHGTRDGVAQRPTALTGPTLDRNALRPVLALTAPGGDWRLPNCPPEVANAQTARSRALAAYAEHITDEVLDPLLHLHHNRLIGIDPDSERTAYRIARHAAVAWVARREVRR